MLAFKYVLHSLPWRRCFAFGSLPTYLLVTKQCVNNIACVQQSDQSWSNTHHDWSDIVVTRCILEYYKQCVNHCLRLNTFCLDLSVQTSWLNPRHLLVTSLHREVIKSVLIDNWSWLQWHQIARCGGLSWFELYSPLAQLANLSWSTTDHDYSDIRFHDVVICLDLSCTVLWLNSRHILSCIIDKQSDLSWSTTDHD